MTYKILGDVAFHLPMCLLSNKSHLQPLVIQVLLYDLYLQSNATIQVVTYNIQRFRCLCINILFCEIIYIYSCYFT